MWVLHEARSLKQTVCTWKSFALKELTYIIMQRMYVSLQMKAVSDIR